jgi:hypothetical protein
MTERSLVVNSDCQAFEYNTPPIIAVAGAVDVVIIAEGFTSFKVQGSSDNGTTYGDIAGSGITGDASLAKRAYVSVYRSLFDHLKVIVDAGHVQIIRRWQRTAPPGLVNPVGTTSTSLVKNLIDPQLGTA